MRLSMQPAGMVPIVSYHTISQRYHPKTWATNGAGNPIQAHISTTPHVCQRKVLKTMSAWQTKKYGQIRNLTQTESARVPNLQRPDDVLVQVYSASVNPVDFKLLGMWAAFHQTSSFKLVYLFSYLGVLPRILYIEDSPPPRTRLLYFWLKILYERQV